MEYRASALTEFYFLIEELKRKFPPRSLNDLTSNNFPTQGVYFFFEDGEFRTYNKTPRIVRVGTHAARANSCATLYSRLLQHKGNKKGGGNHWGSVFRKLVGSAIIRKNGLHEIYPYWLDKSKKRDNNVKYSEKQLEVLVSSYLATLKFISLEVSGPSHKGNDRDIIETNSIALLSNYNRPVIDAPSHNWIGLFSTSRDNKVIRSGLWNDKCVEKDCDSSFLEKFERNLSTMGYYR